MDTRAGWTGAERARYVKAHATPLFSSPAEFLAAIDAITLDSDAIDYSTPGRAAVRWTR